VNKHTILLYSYYVNIAIGITYIGKHDEKLINEYIHNTYNRDK